MTDSIVIADVKYTTLMEEVEKRFNLHQYWQPYHKQFFEFNLSDFVGLPTASELLEATLNIERELGRLQGWRVKDTESSVYKGFSPVYNPELGVDPFSTLGDFRLASTFFITDKGPGKIVNLRNSYYDSYAFRAVHPLAQKYYKPLLDRLTMQLTRSRVGYIFPSDTPGSEYQFHKDEYPFQNLRVNIPLQTSPEYVLEVNGEDEKGSRMKMIKHLEVGKFYVWNTRIPHRVYPVSKPTTDKPRIHLVLGLLPWLNISDTHITRSEFCGIPPFQLVEEGKLFR